MPRYTIVADVRVDVEIEVEAETLDEATRIAKGMDLQSFVDNGDSSMWRIVEGPYWEDSKLLRAALDDEWVFGKKFREVAEKWQVEE